MEFGFGFGFGLHNPNPNPNPNPNQAAQYMSKVVYDDLDAFVAADKASS